MKCQRKRSPYRACFVSRSCARFSPTTSTPASARTPMRSAETYFVAATTVTPSPTSSRIRSYRSATSSGDICDDPLNAPRLAVATVREEEVGVARCADVEPLDADAAGVAERPLGGGPEIEPAHADDVGPE